MLSVVLATTFLSVCWSVCLSRAGNMSNENKRGMMPSSLVDVVFGNKTIQHIRNGSPLGLVHAYSFYSYLAVGLCNISSLGLHVYRLPLLLVT